MNIYENMVEILFVGLVDSFDMGITNSRPMVRTKTRIISLLPVSGDTAISPSAT